MEYKLSITSKKMSDQPETNPLHSLSHQLILLRLHVVCALEQPRKMPDIGKPKLIPHLLHRAPGLRQQLSRLLQPRILKILVDADPKYLPERLFQLRLAH